MNKFDKILRGILKFNILVEFIYIIIIVGIYFLSKLLKNSEIFNFITAFLVIDISNSEKKNLELKSKIKFYDSIMIACKSLLCGFVAPLFYIALFSSNYIGLMYALLFYISETQNYGFYTFFHRILSIVPSLLIQFMFYLLYIIRNRSFHIDFKGDYIVNTLTNPLLNIEIMAAYIESVNFYHHFDKEDMSYVKSYGGYNNKIDEICVKDYLSINYAIAFICFICFMITVYI